MSKPGRDSPFRVMVVDDDDIDVMAVKRAFRKMSTAPAMEVARDGTEALDILRGNGSQERPPRPHLILLDIKMPRMDGFTFLEELRADESLGGTVVFVLTTSTDPDDVEQAYQYNVGGYLVKSDLTGGMTPLSQLVDWYEQNVNFP